MGTGESAMKHGNKYEDLITKLKNGEFKKITFITGAGISTSAGIPDFRSKTGLFAQVQKKYNLSSPEAFFEINCFYKHPEYFYDFCKGFNIDDCKPTKSHLFMGFLNHKGYLSKIYTQNVDGLELKAGLPRDRVVFAHGVTTEAGCPNCLKSVDINVIRKHVLNEKIYYCPDCKKPCKPKVVFYGENLPSSYFSSFEAITQSDLSIIMGTTLKVYPFNRLPYEVPKECWRVLINRSQVSGSIFTFNPLKFSDDYSNDIFISGYTDEVVVKIAKDCGWEEEFNTYIESLGLNK